MTHRSLATYADFQIGDWLVRPSRNLLERDGLPEKLEPKVMLVLLALAERRGGTLSRDELLETVWAGTIVSEDAINRCISRLRRVFAASPSVRIETIPKVGYRLVVRHDGDVLPFRKPLVAREEPRPDSRRRWAGGWALLVAAALGVLAAALARTPTPSDTPPMRVAPFTALPGLEVYPSFSPDGSHVAFVHVRDAARDLYVKPIGSDEMLALTRDDAAETSPRWSPHGTEIAFARRSNEGCSIYVTSSVGGATRKLAECRSASSTELSWSPDGRVLAFTDRESADTPTRVYALTLDTLDVVPLTDPPSTVIGDEDIAFSPDGETLAFSRVRALGVEDIHLMALEDQTLTRLTEDALKIHGLAWEPESRGLVFSSNRTGDFGLWRIDADGGEPTRVHVTRDEVDRVAVSRQGTHILYEAWSASANVWRVTRDGDMAPFLESTRYEWNATFSPDGTRVAFVSDRSGSAEIWVGDANGDNLLRLTSFRGAYTHAPRWSPSGERLAFSSPVDGNFDIYVVAEDGGPLQRLTDHNAQDRTPSWSRDGESVYFASNRSGSWQIWKTSDSSGQAVRVTHEGGAAAIEDPEGRWLYVLKADAPGLWRYPLDGSTDGELVLDDLAPVDRYNWDVTSEGIYYVSREIPNRPAIRLYDGGERSGQDLVQVPDLLYKSGLSVSPDGTLLISRLGHETADLVLLEYDVEH